MEILKNWQNNNIQEIFSSLVDYFYSTLDETSNYSEKAETIKKYAEGSSLFNLARNDFVRSFPNLAKKILEKSLRMKYPNATEETIDSEIAKYIEDEDLRKQYCCQHLIYENAENTERLEAVIKNMKFYFQATDSQLSKITKSTEKHLCGSDKEEKLKDILQGIIATREKPYIAKPSYDEFQYKREWEDLLQNLDKRNPEKDWAKASELYRLKEFASMFVD